MNDMGVASRILGIDIKRDRDEGVMYLSQSNYLLVQRFNMNEAKTMNVPHQLEANLSYLQLKMSSSVLTHKGFHIQVQ